MNLTKKKVISLSLVFVMIMLAFALIVPSSVDAGVNSFTDLPSTHWAYKSVQTMQKMGIIKGYPDGSFGPTKEVTYGEFIKMVVVALDGEDKVVNKEDATHWASGYYAAALDKKLFHQGQIAERQLNSVIDRSDMALICANAINAGDVNDYNGLIERIDDVDKDTKNAYQVLQAYSEGLLTGYEDGTFRPLGSLSRAEASAVIYRITDESARQYPEGVSVTEKVEEEVVADTTTQKYDSDGTPAIGSVWEDAWGTYTIANTTETITNWDEYPNAWEDTVNWLNWTPKMKVYNTEVPCEVVTDWEKGTQFAKDFPDSYDGPFMTVNYPFNCMMAFVVKDNQILHRVGKKDTNFINLGCYLRFYDLPNTYDYILFVGPGDVAGMNDNKNTIFKTTGVDDVACSVPFMFANPFK